jgi:hypothetical protein
LADAQLRQDRLAARQDAEDREASATATLDDDVTAARVAFQQERAQAESGYHQAIGPAWLASIDVQWGAILTQQQAVRGHQRTSDAAIAAATATLNQTVAAQAELRDQHDYNAFTVLKNRVAAQ